MEPSRPALLVTSDSFYPGWRAFVNGRPAPIYRVDGGLRGVPVPSGNSVVRFEYSPLSFKLGLGLTIIALSGTAAVGLLACAGRELHEDRGQPPTELETEPTNFLIE